MAKTTKDDRQKSSYEGELYRLSYVADERMCHDAASLYGSPKLKLFAQALFALGILLVLINALAKLNDLTLLLFGLLFAVSGSVATRNWHNVQAWALMGTNLGESKEDMDRRVIVCESELIVEGPADSILHLPLSELKRVSFDDKGILASFGKARVAYLPAKILSKSRHTEVLRFLQSKCTK